VIRWAMHKLAIEEWLLSAVMAMYTSAKTVVRTVYVNNKCFEVKVGLEPFTSYSIHFFIEHCNAPCQEKFVASLLSLDK